MRKGVYSEWIRVAFRAAPGVKVHGVCKFLLLESGPDLQCYVTPIHIDPEKPAMPISYPAVYSTYLSKRQGPFGTLGLAEDTWALNEGVLGDETFIQQCLDLDRERESMFFDCLDKVKRGLCVCVFDGSDRLQHTFCATPMHRPSPGGDEGRQTPDRVLEELYCRMDALVGRTMAACNHDRSVLMIISDHGFNSFRRGVDLNRWLEVAGYLKVNETLRGEKHLAAIDWSQTRAFAVGLAGIFLNLKGRYSQGNVAPGAEADALGGEIAAKLAALTDPENQQPAVKTRLSGGGCLPRPVHGSRAGPDRGLPARLSRRLGDRHRPRHRRRVSHEPQGLERRSLRRPQPGARRPFLQPENCQRRPALDGHRADGAGYVRRYASALYGRQAVGPGRGRDVAQPSRLRGASF